MLNDDYALLKSFPMLIKYKKDIVFTPEIVEHFLTHYLNTEDEFIEYIPVEHFTTEQYMKVFYANKSTWVLPSYSRMCNENFEVAIRLFEATGKAKFNEDALTPKQWKQVVRIAVKKLNSTKRDLVRHQYSFTPEILIRVAMYFNSRQYKINRNTINNLVYIATNKSFVSFEDEEVIYKLFSDILYDHADLMVRMMPYLYKNGGLMHRFIMDKMKTHANEMVDLWVEHLHISKSEFRFAQHGESWSTDTVRMLQYYLKHHEILESKLLDTAIYRDGIVKYKLKQLAKIFQNFFEHAKVDAYIGALYDQSNHPRREISS